MLLRTRDLAEELLGWYENFDFHRIYQRVVEFCAVDLSALYFDVLKDRLYTFAPDNPSRRSAQTAMHRIADALVRLLAPIMSFTADEIWEFLPGSPGKLESVHLALFPAGDELAPASPQTEQLRSDWRTLMLVRDEALKQLEEARKSKLIGSALEAHVTLLAPKEVLETLRRHQQDLEALLIVSGISFAASANELILAAVARAAGEKCERCWHYSTHVGADPDFPTVCERCAPALKEILA